MSLLHVRIEVLECVCILIKALKGKSPGPPPPPHGRDMPRVFPAKEVNSIVHTWMLVTHVPKWTNSA